MTKHSNSLVLIVFCLIFCVCSFDDLFSQNFLTYIENTNTSKKKTRYYQIEVKDSILTKFRHIKSSENPILLTACCNFDTISPIPYAQYLTLIKEYSNSLLKKFEKKYGSIHKQGKKYLQKVAKSRQSFKLDNIKVNLVKSEPVVCNCVMRITQNSIFEFLHINYIFGKSTMSKLNHGELSRVKFAIMNNEYFVRELNNNF